MPSKGDSDVRTSRDRLRIAHIVPTLDIGGVEVAIERSLDELRSRFDYRVFTVRGNGGLQCGQRGVAFLLWDCFRGVWRPDVVITSLWWSHPFGFVLQRFSCRWLAFFHSTHYAHAIEKSLVRWAWRKADARVADSEATAGFLKKQSANSANIVPYVFSEDSVPSADRDIDLVWVGRNSPEKRLDLVRDFIRALARRSVRGRAALVVAGAYPEVFRSLAEETGWEIQVFLSLGGPRVRQILRRSHFYLLVSDYEGMSMSTTEAVQAGCVPVVRPVGEIIRYLDSRSAVFIEDSSRESIERAIDGVCALWHGAEAKNVSACARENLRAIPYYVDALAAAINAAARR